MSDPAVNVLFITRSPLHRGNSTGQTLCNFFDITAFPHKDTDFHVLTLESRSRGRTERGFAASSLYIGNRDLVRAICGMPLPLPRAEGSTPPAEPSDTPCTPVPTRGYRRIKASTTLRYLAYIPRDFLWLATSPAWKRAVRAYVEEVKPDILFFPTSGQGYHHRVLRYVGRLTAARGTRVILYHGDDHFTLRTGSPNPVFYPRRLAERLRIKRAVRMCDAQFGASEAQCVAYERGMGKRCVFLSKSLDFSAPPAPLPPHKPPVPLSLVYTGNILLGRWESLVYLARLLDRLRGCGLSATLSVYSANPLTRKMEKAVSETQSLRFMGAISPTEVVAVQQDADVLVHAESFVRTHRAIVRQSFSTKLVDYLHASRPILAVGPADVASVAYLCDHAAALHLEGKHHEKEDLATLTTLFDPAVRKSYARRAYTVGRVGHDVEVMRGRLTEAMGLEWTL